MEAYFSAKSRERLLRSCRERALSNFKGRPKAEREALLSRFDVFAPRLIDQLHGLYHDQYDFGLHLSALTDVLCEAWKSRPKKLRETDEARLENSEWFRSHKMAGAVCYVDLFAGDLKGVEAKIPYLLELGITYLHLMPLFKSPEQENDGGYAVSSYREVNPALGTVKQLEKLATKLAANGISLVLDFINNHTSDEHEWAERAKKGEAEFQDYYYIFDDRRIPDAFEPNLREIFPEVRRGNYSWHEPPGKWIWTTFHNYQWDLNYRNPAVFVAMVREMLFLANLGVDFLRLDAVPFTWKVQGTVCENLPQAHDIIRALNACARIAAPGLLFKSEAIVHPDDVIAYVAPDKCQVSYNPTVMALLWESLATREVRLLRESLKYRFTLPEGTAWINYVRSHDDIGWSFADEDAATLGINGFDHRNFLNQFYCGDFPGTFSKGVKFQYNPSNGDMRVCGTTASLAGLERGLEMENEAWAADAVGRILLMYGLCMSIGGIPLLYLGDETGTLNDYSYSSDPGKKGDNRWVHRPAFDWQLLEQIREEKGPRGRLFRGLKKLLGLRAETPQFAENGVRLLQTHHASVLAFEKSNSRGKLCVVANFCEHPVIAHLPNGDSLMPHRDLITGREYPEIGHLDLEPYQLMWLQRL
ncbi:MAG: amylosucrase [Candidatus Cyclonatronum sp.]|uniref:alpha-amylase family protein n=1 Tax=Cyclonatronum sp. TaxID=3024185 RepID=UPI0025BC775F|nr:alpha-amylase family protein [Cyclonatronum sp.]MCH8486154.1 amylosucrase [Cyclonatronum sp.]